MPCYTVRTVSVDLTVANYDILHAALKAAGCTEIVVSARVGISARTKEGERFTIANGQLSMRSPYADRERVADVAGQIKTAYAKQAVMTAAKQNGWGVTTNKKTGQMALQRKAW